MRPFLVRMAFAMGAAGASFGLLPGCDQPRGSAAGGARAPETGHAATAPGLTEAAGPGLHLDVAAQARLALKIAPAAAGTLPRELKAYGRVLDPAPLAALAAELFTARSTLEAARKEFQRVQRLSEQNQNASARAVEAAEAALQRAEVTLEATHWRLVSGWGRPIAEQADLSGLVRSLTLQEQALVRLDLPAGTAAAPPTGARLFSLAAPEQAVPATFSGPAPSVESQAQGQGFLFLAQTAGNALRPGEALLGQLTQPGAPLTGVLVPSSAVLRAEGTVWVYVQSGDTTFVRREIRLDFPTHGGWLVTGGVAPEERLVVTGVQMLLSEERKSSLPGSH